jgi:phospholipid transport system substrate-binding protein
MLSTLIEKRRISLQRMRKKIILIPFIVFLGMSSYAYGSEPLDTLKNSINDVLDILTDPLYKDGTKWGLQGEKIQAKIRDLFDSNEMAKRALGRHWRELTPKQQVEFTDLFSQFLQKVYIKRIQGHTNERVVYLSENMIAKLQATVKIKIITGTSEIPINCRMVMKKETWKIYDVNIEGVSLVRNYRAQFQKILMKESPDALIGSLKKKVRGGQEREFAEVNKCFKKYLSRLGPLLRSGSSKAKIFTLRTDIRMIHR